MMYLMKSNVTRFARCYAPWLSARLQAGCSFRDVDSEVRAVRSPLFGLRRPQCVVGAFCPVIKQQSGGKEKTPPRSKYAPSSPSLLDGGQPNEGTSGD